MPHLENNQYQTLRKMAVFGAGGRVGLPFAVHHAKKERMRVIGVELHQDYCDVLNTGIEVPFEEKGLSESLHYAVNVLSRPLKFMTLNDETRYEIMDSDIFVIMVGTPLVGTKDKLSTIMINSIVDQIVSYLETSGPQKQRTIAIRSTVPIGYTDKLSEKYKDADYINFMYWPERVIEGDALKEFGSLPDLCGIDESRWDQTYLSKVFHALDICALQPITCREAEFAKIASNAARYAYFAITNDLMIQAEKFGVDYNKLLPVMKWNYDRLKFLPSPGINTGGPCLSKDWAELDSDLLREVNAVNQEKMVDFVVDSIKKLGRENPKVLYLGATFKPNSDDARNSIILPLLAKSMDAGIDYDVYDPIAEMTAIEDISKYDVFVVVTPHDCFERFFQFIAAKANPEADVLDFWNAYHTEKHKHPLKRRQTSFKVGELKRQSL